MLRLLSALVLTLLIELPLGAWLLKSKSALIPLFLINTLTNPALNASLILLLAVTHSRSVYLAALFTGELMVFIGEGLLIHTLCDIPPRRAAYTSLLLNACSLTVGCAVSAWLW